MNQEQNNFNNIQNNNMVPNTQGMMPNMDMNGQVFNQQPVMGPANVEQVVQQQVQEVIQPVQPVMSEVQPEPQIVSQVNVQEPVNVVSTIEQPAMQVPVQEQVVTPVQEAVQMAAGVSNPEPTQIHSIIENTNNVIEPTQAVIPDTPVQPILEQQVSMPVQEPIQTANIVEPVQAEPQIVNQVNVQEPAPQMSQPVVMPEMNNQPTMEQPQTTIQPNVLNNQNVINPVNTETNNQNNTPVNDIKPPKKKSSFLTVVLVIIALGASFVAGIYIYNNFLTEKDTNNTGTGDGDTNILNNEQVDEQENTNEDADESDEASLLTGTYKVPLQEIYVDTPAFNMIESGFSRLFMVNDEKYATFTCLYEETGTNAKEAFTTTFDKLKENLFGYHQVNELNEVEESNVNVNGIETYSIKGTVNCGTENKYDAYIYGYSFVFGGYPTSIIGIVEDQAQAQEDIDEITSIVDAMMKSVRSER